LLRLLLLLLLFGFPGGGTADLNAPGSEDHRARFWAASD
jgi:hypothetical protein